MMMQSVSAFFVTDGCESGTAVGHSSYHEKVFVFLRFLQPVLASVEHWTRPVP